MSFFCSQLVSVLETETNPVKTGTFNVSLQRNYEPNPNINLLSYFIENNQFNTL